MWSPRRNRTGDPILTIDAPVVHNAMHHLTSPHIDAGERRCRGLRCGARRGCAWRSFWQISGTARCGWHATTPRRHRSDSPSARSNWHPWCIALLSRLRVERSARRWRPSGTWRRGTSASASFEVGRQVSATITCAGRRRNGGARYSKRLGRRCNWAALSCRSSRTGGVAEPHSSSLAANASDRFRR